MEKPVWEFGRWLRFKSVSVRTLYLLTTTFSIRFFPTFAPSHPTNIYCKRADQNRFVKTKKIERDIAGQISSVLPSRPLRAPLMNSFQLSFLTAWFSCSFRSDLRPFAIVFYGCWRLKWPCLWVVRPQQLEDDRKSCADGGAPGEGAPGETASFNSFLVISRHLEIQHLIFFVESFSNLQKYDFTG